MLCAIMKAMDRRKTWLMITTVLILVLVSSVYFDSLATTWSYDDVSLRFAKMLNNKKSSYDEKKILLWTSMFSDDWFYFGKSGHFENCPKYNNCLLTRTRNLVNITKFSAILFHGNELNYQDVPWNRDPEQEYVFVNLESPKNRPMSSSFFENFFNLTMTYRLDSDILWPYYNIQEISTKAIVAPLQEVKWAEPSYDPLMSTLDGLFEKKKKMAAWLVSNCETSGRREVYVNELMEYVKVDRIGKCGDADAPKCKDSQTVCFTEIIEPEYFFYLSFENTLCQDYVTEKFSNALRHNVIPVVYGGANYSLHAPPHSYIDALDFDSPKALAIYLTKLSQNKEEYLKYFWWKRYYTVGYPTKSVLCSLCELLNVNKGKKSYSPLSDWFEKDKCPINNYLIGHEHATKQLRSRAIGEKLPPKS